MKEAFAAFFQKGQPYDVECRVRRADGEWIWVHDRAVATYERDGVRYADGLLSDISERKRIEEALQIERDNLNAIFASAPVGMLLLNEETVIVDANAEVAAMVFRGPAEISISGLGPGWAVFTATKPKGDAVIPRLAQLVNCGTASIRFYLRAHGCMVWKSSQPCSSAAVPAPGC